MSSPAAIYTTYLHRVIVLAAAVLVAAYFFGYFWGVYDTAVHYFELWKLENGGAG